MMNAIVVGSGISGLSIGRLLSDRFNVHVLEQYDSIGGLVKCKRIDGNLFHKVGGHVFNSKNKTVLDWFWKYFDREIEFVLAKRNAKIFLGNQIIGYPIENHLYQLPEQIVETVLDEFFQLLKYDDVNNSNTSDNFEDFLMKRFGSKLFKLYFGPYNSKIWKTDLKKIPLPWLDGKLPVPDIRNIIRSNILRKSESEMVHNLFFYPRTGGSQFIVDRIAENQNISLNYRVETIQTTPSGELSVNYGDHICDLLVYTGDVRRLKSIIDIHDDHLNELLSSVQRLESNGTSNILCVCDRNEISWMYCPESDLKPHRIIYTGNFSVTNNASDRIRTCVVEFSGKFDQDVMIKDIKKLPGNLKPIAINYEADSYVIQNHDSRKRIAELKDCLKRYNIYLLGRFAEWEYYNMDKCVESAMEVNHSVILSGI